MRLVSGFCFSSGNSISSFRLTVPEWSVSSFLNLGSKSINQTENIRGTQNAEFYLFDNLEISAAVRFVDEVSCEAVLPMIMIVYFKYL